MIRSSVSVVVKQIARQVSIPPSSFYVMNRYSSSQINDIRNEIPGEQKSGWTTIYRFPYIGIISALNRTKWYQLGATVLGCPLAYALELAGEVGAGTAVICGAVGEFQYKFDQWKPPQNPILSGVSATLATTAFSKLSSGTVGFLYLDKSDTTARFGFVDSNGKRQDVLCPVDKLQSQGENRFFIRITTQPEDQTSKLVQLKLFHSHGIISDVGKFNQIL